MIKHHRILVGILFLLAFITIVDRVCISAAKNDIAVELSISDLSFGFVFGAFAIGYTVCMVPSGWLGDLLGPRRFLTGIVCLWSALTLMTGLVQTFRSLVIVRLLFGGAEAGAFPAAARAISDWLPLQSRGLALGLLNAGSRLGAALGLSIMSVSIVRLGWRLSFAIVGVVGFIWAIVWHAWFHDRSGTVEQMHGNKKTAVTKQVIDVRVLLLSTNSAILLVQYFASNFTFFICFSWLLPYLRHRFALSTEQAGIYASIPLYFGSIATWAGGLSVDWLHRRGKRRLSRRLPAMAGFSIAATGLLAAAYMNDPRSFILFFAFTTFGVDLTLSPSWTVCSDIASIRTGTLSGAMNAAGSLGSFFSSICFPWLLGMTGTVKPYFFSAALLNLIAVACWWYCDSFENVDA